MKKRPVWQFFLIYGLTQVILLLPFLYLTFSHFKGLYREKNKEEMRTYLNILSLIPPERIITHTSELARITESRLTVIDREGLVIADSEVKSPKELENHLSRPEIQEAMKKGLGFSYHLSRSTHREMLYVAISTKKGYLRLAKPLTEINEAAFAFSLSLLKPAFFLLLLSFALSLLFLRKIIVVLHKLEECTNNIGRVEDAIALQEEMTKKLPPYIKEVVKFCSEKESRLREEKKELETIFHLGANGLLLLDRHLRIVTQNKAMENFLACPHELSGKYLMEVIRHADLKEAVEHALTHSTATKKEITFPPPQDHVWEVSIVPLKEETFRGGKVILSFSDITKSKAWERRSGTFVANVAHELKTPLTAIIGFTETLLMEVKEESTTNFLTKIDAHAQRLKRLIDDLLLLAELESKPERMLGHPIDIHEALREVLSSFAHAAKAKGLSFFSEVPPSLPKLAVNRDKFIQAMANLLDNAVKFTEKGSVTLKVEKEEDYLTVRINDTGIGIPAHELPFLGERFYRGEKAKEGKISGFGLGLSIVKEMMEALGGRLVIESEIGRGTISTLYFPLSKGEIGVEDCMV